MRYLSVCSGIEAATVAWHPLGWTAAAYSEIEPFPRAVLTHHYPGTPLHGDFTTIGGEEYGPVDLLVGGTPCQSFSVAGLRGGMDDPRGNLALGFLQLARRSRARWVVWENVPGVLSSNGGRDFGSILGGLAQLGYGWAYRVLDAQFFGVAQRRRRVFVVGYLGDWRRAAAVLFERHSLQGHPAPRREAGQGTAISPSLRARANSSHRADSQAFIPDVSYALTAHGGAHGRQDAESETFVAHTLKGEGFDASEDGTGRGTPIVPVSFPWQVGGTMGMGHSVDHVGTLVKNQTQTVAYAIQERAVSENPDAGPDGAGFRGDGAAYTLEARTVPQAVAFALRGREGGAMPELGGDQVGSLRAASGGSSRDYVAFGIGSDAVDRSGEGASGTAAHRAGLNITEGFQPALRARPNNSVATSSAVRRLTAEECEALQGFPRSYTLIPWRKGLAPDGPRYKALGNSFAVPVVRWIGERIQAVEEITNGQGQEAQPARPVDGRGGSRAA